VPILHAERGVDVFEMALHRAGADAEEASDLAIGLPLRDPIQYLLLAVAQPECAEPGGIGRIGRKTFFVQEKEMPRAIRILHVANRETRCGAIDPKGFALESVLLVAKPAAQFTGQISGRGIGAEIGAEQIIRHRPTGDHTTGGVHFHQPLPEIALHSAGEREALHRLSLLPCGAQMRCGEAEQEAIFIGKGAAGAKAADKQGNTIFQHNLEPEIVLVAERAEDFRIEFATMPCATGEMLGYALRVASAAAIGGMLMAEAIEVRGDFHDVRNLGREMTGNAPGAAIHHADGSEFGGDQTLEDAKDSQLEIAPRDAGMEVQNGSIETSNLR